MDTYYHIRVKGHLDSHWSAWFDNMTICNEAERRSDPAWAAADQAALQGL